MFMNRSYINTEKLNFNLDYYNIINYGKSTYMWMENLRMCIGKASTYIDSIIN